MLNPVLGADGTPQFYIMSRKCFLVLITQTAMDSVFPGSYFVAIALFFFAFTTMLAYYYIAKQIFLFDKEFKIAYLQSFA
jgi:AGCS family alanine or glycine:cation symporter